MNKIMTVGDAAAYFTKLALRAPDMPIFRGDGEGGYLVGLYPEVNDVVKDNNGDIQLPRHGLSGQRQRGVTL
jgi:hypothetical protein